MICSFKEKIRKTARVGVVITGNEVYHGRIKDAFAPVITKKIEEVGGELVGVYYAPDDKAFIVDRLRELLNAGADLLITTGGMSVDPDDVTRFAIRELGGTIHLWLGGSSRRYVPYPYLDAAFPIIGIPGLRHVCQDHDLRSGPSPRPCRRTDRTKEVAALGHGGLCMKCDVCRYPVCPFGKLGMNLGDLKTEDAYGISCSSVHGFV